MGMTDGIHLDMEDSHSPQKLKKMRKQMAELQKELQDAGILDAAGNFIETGASIEPATKPESSAIYCLIEKPIAKAIKEAHQLHEESWQIDAGEYTKSWEECFIKACEKFKLPVNIWYILFLANHWYNDLQSWSEIILAGKNIL